MKRSVFIAVLISAAPLLSGCGGPEPPAPTDQTQTSEPAKAGEQDPDLPAGMNKDELVSKPLIKDTTVADRRRTAAYRRNRKVPTGGVLGLCYVPFDKAVTVPHRLYVAVEDANAVRDPEKDEAAYYKTHIPWGPVLLSAFDARRKRYTVERAAIIVRGVREGAREPLGRPILLMDYRTRQLQVAKNGYNYSAGRVVFMPLNERIQFYNIEFYSCRPVIARTDTDEVVFRGALPGYHDPKFPGQHYGTSLNMAQPKMLLTPPVTELGRYRVTCERHPWLAAHLFAVDNPYVALSGEDGVFRLPGLPEGTYQVDVWHPLYEPEQRSRELRILAYKTPELLIRFKPPKRLTDPPPLPATPIEKWAAVGPFEVGREAYPPERALDFRAAYPTKYHYHPVPQPLRWRVSDGRLGHYYATAYFYTELHSPKPQKVRFGFGAVSHKRGWQGIYTVRAWVNGKPIYSYHGDWHGRNAAIVPYELAAGKNGLLVRLDTSRYNHWTHVFATFESEGVTTALPAPLRPKRK